MPEVDDNGVAALDQAPAAAEAQPEVQPEVQVDERPKIVVEDDEVRAVAEAMDVDGILKWDSSDHGEIVACLNALDDARHMLIGFKACVQVEHEGWMRKYEASEDAEPLVRPVQLRPVTAADDDPRFAQPDPGSGVTGMESPPAPNVQGQQQQA